MGITGLKNSMAALSLQDPKADDNGSTISDTDATSGSLASSSQSLLIGPRPGSPSSVGSVAPRLKTLNPELRTEIRASLATHPSEPNFVAMRTKQQVEKWLGTQQLDAPTTHKVLERYMDGNNSHALNLSGLGLNSSVPPIPLGIQELDLSGNKFCSTALAQVVQATSKPGSTLKSLDISHNGLPRLPHFPPNSSLTEVNAEGNDLHQIDPSVYALSQDSKVNLGHNPIGEEALHNAIATVNLKGYQGPTIIATVVEKNSPQSQQRTR
jgi:hypothetical protein